jgi:hypothetical protein
MAVGIVPLVFQYFEQSPYDHKLGNHKEMAEFGRDKQFFLGNVRK